MTGILAKEVIISSMSQIYSVDTPLAEDEISPFFEDLSSVGTEFGRASLLTIQETINIIPRTINLVPLINIGEVAFFPVQDEGLDTTRLEGSLLEAFSSTAGSPALGPIAAVAFNVFVLLYTPCVSAISAMRQEFGQRWMWAQIIYTLVLAWGAAVIVFQVGRLIFI